MILIIKNHGTSVEQTTKSLKDQGYTILDIITDNKSTDIYPKEELTSHNFAPSITSPLHQEGTPQINDHFFVKDNHRFEKVRHADILWMKAENSYVCIKTILKSYLLTSYTLGSMLKKTNNAGLIRIHRSYAVNLSKVEALEGNQVVIDQQRIPIGKNYQSEIKGQFSLV